MHRSCALVKHRTAGLCASISSSAEIVSWTLTLKGLSCMLTGWFLPSTPVCFLKVVALPSQWDGIVILHCYPLWALSDMTLQMSKCLKTFQARDNVASPWIMGDAQCCRQILGVMSAEVSIMGFLPTWSRPAGETIETADDVLPK